MTAITIILIGIILAGEVYFHVINVRNRNRNKLDRHDIEIEAVGLSKRRNELDNFEHQIKGDAMRLRHGDFFETATISAEKNPTKKKARKMLASKFGYDIIDLIKIHEFKNDDGSVTYKAEFHILYNTEGKNGSR